MEAPLTHYQLLGLSPAATPEQIDRAYRYAMEMYSEGSLATYSLLDPQEVRATRLRIEQAYGVLREPVRRRRYDAILGFGPPEDGVGASEPEPVIPESPSGPRSPVAPLAALVPPAAGVPRAVFGSGPVPGHLPPPLRVAPRPLAEVSGSSLRELRQEMGLALSDIAASSKIGVRFLEYIEDERYDRLPATVYLRGFLKEYARALGLDPIPVAEAYLARVPQES
jgi:flagellar biosynthesis protein FlhG